MIQYNIIEKSARVLVGCEKIAPPRFVVWQLLQRLGRWVGKPTEGDKVGFARSSGPGWEIIIYNPDVYHVERFLTIERRDLTVLPPPNSQNRSPKTWPFFRIVISTKLRDESKLNTPLTLQALLAIPNIEIRSVLLALLGNKFLERELDIHKFELNPRGRAIVHLDGLPCNVLVAECPSTKRRFLIPVPSYIQDAEEAAAWTFNIPSKRWKEEISIET